MERLERVLKKVKPGSFVTALVDCCFPYALKKGNQYQVLDVKPLYRDERGPTPQPSRFPVGPLCNVEFTILDDRTIEIDIPYLNFSY